MSDMITFDTGESVKEIAKIKSTAVKVETFDLVSEDHPILKQVLPVFDFTKPPVDPNKFASTLVETCKKYNGYGLSANQCGFNHRVFVVGAGDDYVAFFNPEIVETKGEEHMAEMCLSFPMMPIFITRPKEVTIKYQDFTGALHVENYVGLTARCILHELDHMNGIVYTSRAKPLALQSGLKKRNKMMKMLRKIDDKTSKWPEIRR
jgi:peptide deformylase